MLLYSPVYVVLITFFITLLSLQVSFLRARYKIPSGDGGHSDLAHARSAHSMALEYSVVFLPLLVCSELMGVSNQWIAYTSLGFLAGRIIHCSALMKSSGFSYGRLVGVSLSHFASLALMAKLALILASIRV